MAAKLNASVGVPVSFLMQPDLHSELKEAVAERGTTMRSFLNQCVAAGLKQKRRPAFPHDSKRSA